MSATRLRMLEGPEMVRLGVVAVTDIAGCIEVVVLAAI